MLILMGKTVLIHSGSVVPTLLRWVHICVVPDIYTPAPFSTVLFFSCLLLLFFGGHLFIYLLIYLCDLFYLSFPLFEYYFPPCMALISLQESFIIKSDL